MPTVQIDPNILIKAMTAAIQAAVIQQPTTEKPKRGRPKKVVEISNDTEIITVQEEDKKVLEEHAGRNPSKNFVVQAKTLDKTNVVGTACGVEDVTKNRGKQKFIDIENVGDRIPASKYPEPTERRKAVEKMPFKCDRCNQRFEAYPSEIPQAFMKEKITGVAEGKPRVLCDGCIGK